MEKLFETYQVWVKTDADPRVRDWFLMSSPFPTVIICAFYLTSAKLLNIWMKPRKPMNIRWMILCFDLLHLVGSVVVLSILIRLKVFSNFNFRCEPLDPSPGADRIVKLTWWYFLYNFTFFSEIYIFVLGKRHDRITKYFLNHHIALPLSIWWLVKFSPTGHALFFGFINCCTHLISFGYLVLIGAIPRLRKYFWWWKRFFQILLFLRIAVIVTHGLQLFIWNDCKYPMIYPIIVLINTPIFIALTVSDYVLNGNKKIRSKNIADNENLMNNC